MSTAQFCPVSELDKLLFGDGPFRIQRRGRRGGNKFCQKVFEQALHRVGAPFWLWGQESL